MPKSRRKSASLSKFTASTCPNGCLGPGAPCVTTSKMRVEEALPCKDIPRTSGKHRTHSRRKRRSRYVGNLFLRQKSNRQQTCLIFNFKVIIWGNGKLVVTSFPFPPPIPLPFQKLRVMINKIYLYLRLLLFNIVFPVIFFLLLATPARRNLPRLFKYRLTKTIPSQKLRGGDRKNIIGIILFCFSRIDKKSSSLPHYSLLYYTKNANVFSSLKIVYAFRFSKYFIVYSTPVTLFRYLKF